MSSLLLPTLTPADLGFDSAEFPAYRQSQLEAIEFAAYSEKRVVGLCLPTGSGKMLTAVSLAKLTGMRTVIGTVTKGLQGQYLEKHLRDGLVDIRGRRNYTCEDHSGMNCRDGVKFGCRVKECGYDIAKWQARNSSVVSTNYDFWMAVNDHANGLERLKDEENLLGRNPVELLILDEAHAAPNKVADYLSCRLYERELDRWKDDHPKSEDIKEWADWASGAADVLDEEVRTLGMELAFLGRDKRASKVLESLHKTEGLLSKLERLESAEESEWIAEEFRETKYGRIWNFDVVWPGRYAEKYLFCRVPKVVLMSATLRPKTLGLLGVKKEEYEFREWPRVFQRSKCTIYFCPPVRGDGKTIRVTRKTGAGDLRLWVEHIDRLVQGQLQHRIVVLTTSYKYQAYLKEHSRFSEYMVGNTDDPESESAEVEFERFIKAKPPIILCSPSFGTGWDFKGERCRFMVISKVPLRSPQGKLIEARLARDKQYGDAETMQDVVQAAGRIQRNEEDWGVVVLTDASWEWFGHKNRNLAPVGFVDEVRRVSELPKNK